MISSLIIARDEARNIAACIRSLHGLAGEILVAVDSRTRDDTIALARSNGARVFVVEWKGYGSTRNEVLAETNGDWVLWIDADERMTPELANEIREMLSSQPDVDAFAIPRKAFFLGKWIRHCGWYPGYVTRLFRKGRARFSERPVHERLEVEGRVARLKHPLLHYTDPDLAHYLRKLNNYTSLAAGELFSKKHRPRMFDLTIRPCWFFVRNYVFRLGFLDGVEGLLLCIFSGYSVLMKYLKLQELWDREGRA